VGLLHLRGRLQGLLRGLQDLHGLRDQVRELKEQLRVGAGPEAELGAGPEAGPEAEAEAGPEAEAEAGPEAEAEAGPEVEEAHVHQQGATLHSDHAARV